MKRNLDLIRDLLLHLQDNNSVDLSGYSEEEISFHCYLLVDAGFANGEMRAGAKDELSTGTLYHLRWAGYEFIELSKNDGQWQKAKKFVAEKGGNMALSVITAILIQATKSSLGLP